MLVNWFNDPAILVLLAASGAVVAALLVFACSFGHYSLAVFLVALSPFLSSLFIPNTGELLSETTGSYLRLSLLGLISVAGAIVSVRARIVDGAQTPRHMQLLALFLLLAMVSGSYSIEPSYTLIRAGGFGVFALCLLGMHFWVRDDKGMDDALNAILAMLVVCLLLNAASLVLWNERAWKWNAPSRFQGLWAHPNTMGTFCMLCYPVLIWKFYRSGTAIRLAIAPLMMAAILMHIVSGSRTSLLTACIGLLVFFGSIRRFGVALCILICSGLLAFTVYELRPPSFQRQGTADLTDLTGRAETWRLSMQYIAKQPLLGYGFDVDGAMLKGDRSPVIYFKRLPGVRISLHNGYLSILSGLGVVGLTLWLWTVLYGVARAVRSPRGEHKAVVLSIMIMALFANFTETSITGGRSLLGVFFWLAWTLSSRMPDFAVATEPGLNEEASLTPATCAK